MGPGRRDVSRTSKRKAVQDVADDNVRTEKKTNRSIVAVQSNGKRVAKSKQTTATVIKEDVLIVRNGAVHKEVDSIDIVIENTAKKLKKQKSRVLEVSIQENDLPVLRAKAAKIYDKLMELYEDPPCPLDHENHFQLLVAIILSAQSTDKKVNKITPALFKLAPDAKSMASLKVTTIEGLIKHIGLAPTKAKNILATAEAISSKHGGVVPNTFEDLEDLPGVGHKTASVLLAIAHGMPTFPVDTHIHRLAQRWGLTNGKNVEQTEADLKAIFPEAQWNPLHLRIIYFGREHCPAKAHDPTSCAICSWAAVPPYDRIGSSPLKPGQKSITSFFK